MSPVLVAIMATVGIVALLAVLYLYVLPQSGSAAAEPAAATELEQPATASTPAPRGRHPLAKHLEITGLRIVDSSGGRAKIQFLVVNHSGANLPDLELAVMLRSGDRDLFEFPAKLPSLGPYESKDLSVAVKTSLRPYEMPDWQMVKPQFTITSEP